MNKNILEIAKFSFNTNYQTNSIKYTQAHLDKVMQDYPDLTSYGLGRFEYRDFDRDREELKNDLGGFKVACIYTTYSNKLSRIDKTISSNDYTFRVQAFDYPHLFNGTFIAAALHMGFKLRRYPESPNAYFNMSDHLYRELMKK